MILQVGIQKSHSHCCKTCALKRSKIRWFGAPAPDTQTGVTRRHRPSEFCGEDRMHRKASVYSRQSHSPIEWAIGHSNTENPHNEPCGQALLHSGAPD